MYNIYICTYSLNFPAPDPRDQRNLIGWLAEGPAPDTHFALGQRPALGQLPTGHAGADNSGNSGLGLFQVPPGGF